MSDKLGPPFHEHTHTHTHTHSLAQMTKDYLNMPDSEVAGWVRGRERHWTTERPASLLLRRRIEQKWKPPAADSTPPHPLQYPGGHSWAAGSSTGNRGMASDAAGGRVGAAQASSLSFSQSKLSRAAPTLGMNASFATGQPLASTVASEENLGRESFCGGLGGFTDRAGGDGGVGHRGGVKVENAFYKSSAVLGSNGRGVDGAVEAGAMSTMHSCFLEEGESATVAKDPTSGSSMDIDSGSGSCDTEGGNAGAVKKEGADAVEMAGLEADDGAEEEEEEAEDDAEEVGSEMFPVVAVVLTVVLTVVLVLVESAQRRLQIQRCSCCLISSRRRAESDWVRQTKMPWILVNPVWGRGVVEGSYSSDEFLVWVTPRRNRTGRRGAMRTRERVYLLNTWVIAAWADDG